MKSVTSPYAPFEGFYPLDEVIDTYMEIWYRDDSDDSSSWMTIKILRGVDILSFGFRSKWET